MNTMHEANRRYWNEAAGWWERLEEVGGVWRRCASEPDLAFAGGALGLVREFVGDMSGKDVCVVGSGDNPSGLRSCRDGRERHVGGYL